jgi:hypothetical protein
MVANFGRTTVPQISLAEKLVLGSPANVSQQLRRNEPFERRRSLPLTSGIGGRCQEMLTDLITSGATQRGNLVRIVQEQAPGT